MNHSTSRIINIAQTAYAAERVWRATHGEDAPPIWSKLSEEGQNAFLAKVHFHIDNPLLGDAGLHNIWMNEQTAAGWTFGKVFDETAKTDPRIKDFHLLPVEEQSRDRLLLAIVKALSRV